MTQEEANAAMLAAIPATGEIPFEEFRTAVIAAGNKDALHGFKKAHKTGAFAVRVDKGVLLVRQSATPIPG
jgi:hypothetical protein